MHWNYDFILKYKEFFLYALLGITAMLFNWMTYSVLIPVLPMVAANLLSWSVTMIFTFLTNKVYVFGSRDFRKGTLVKEGMSFLTSRGVTGVLEVVLQPQLYEMGFREAFFGVEGMQAKMIVCVALSVVNYVVTKLWVFRGSRTGGVKSFLKTANGYK